MPIYLYLCLSCSSNFEELLSISKVDELEKELKCPKCDSLNKKRIIAGGNFVLRGNGWTQNNSRDSTGSIKDYSETMKDDLKNIKSSDLYNNVPTPKNAS